jgi:hypothetical protein
MKNILKYSAAVVLLAGTLKADKIKIINDTDEALYVSLVTTAKGSKGKKLAFKGIFEKTLGSGNVLKPLGIHQAFDVENFKSDSNYDRTLWVSNDSNSLSTALENKQITSEAANNVYAFEVGGYNKSVVIRSKPYPQAGFKFDAYKIFKPKLSNNATITEVFSPQIITHGTRVS